MKSKTCPHCDKESWSAGAVPWICPYPECGQKIAEAGEVNDLKETKKEVKKMIRALKDKLVVYLDFRDWAIPLKVSLGSFSFELQIGPLLIIYWRF